MATNCQIPSGGYSLHPRVSRRRSEWARGYFCAVALLLREEGGVTTSVRSLYAQGGDPAYAEDEDFALFAKNGLTEMLIEERDAEQLEIKT